jgi:hypothetical protein
MYRVFHGEVLAGKRIGYMDVWRESGGRLMSE